MNAMLKKKVKLEKTSICSKKELDGGEALFLFIR